MLLLPPVLLCKSEALSLQGPWQRPRRLESHVPRPLPHHHPLGLPGSWTAACSSGAAGWLQPSLQWPWCRLSAAQRRGTLQAETHPPQADPLPAAVSWPDLMSWARKTPQQHHVAVAGLAAAAAVWIVCFDWPLQGLHVWWSAQSELRPGWDQPPPWREVWAPAQAPEGVLPRCPPARAGPVGLGQSLVRGSGGSGGGEPGGDAEGPPEPRCGGHTSGVGGRAAGLCLRSRAQDPAPPADAGWAAGPPAAQTAAVAAVTRAAAAALPVLVTRTPWKPLCSHCCADSSWGHLLAGPLSESEAGCYGDQLFPHGAGGLDLSGHGCHLL